MPIAQRISSLSPQVRQYTQARNTIIFGILTFGSILCIQRNEKLFYLMLVLMNELVITGDNELINYAIVLE